MLPPDGFLGKLPRVGAEREHNKNRPSVIGVGRSLGLQVTASPAAAVFTNLTGEQIRSASSSGRLQTPRWREPDSNPRSPSYGELGALGARDATHATSAKPGIASVARELGEGSILW